MGKKGILNLAKAFILTFCMMLGIFLTTGIVTAYATEPEDDPSNETTIEDPGPLDYVLTCDSEPLDFGVIYEGDSVGAKRFTIKNDCEFDVPLQWTLKDGADAFRIDCISDGEDTSGGDNSEDNAGGVSFFSSEVAPEDGPSDDESPENDSPSRFIPGDYDDVVIKAKEELELTISLIDGLKQGKYEAGFVFYSVNDVNLESDGNTEVTAKVSVIPHEPVISNVEVIPNTETIQAGKSYQFNKKVSGAYDYDDSVRWSVRGNTSTGTKIDSDGVLTVGNDETQASLTVIATSRQDTNHTGIATVNVQFNNHIVNVSADPAEGGEVTGGGTVTHGGGVRVYATKNKFYDFVGWYEGNNLISTSAQLNLTGINKDVDLVAKFKIARYTITANVSPSNAGRVENSGTYDGGSQVFLRAEPYDGYDFVGWVISSRTVSNDLEYEIASLESNITITASFKQQQARTFRIESGTANEGGKIVPNGNTDIEEGKSVTYNMTPESGYRVHAVAVDGVSIGAVNSYTFSDVRQEHSIAVSFERIPEEAGSKSSKQGSSTRKSDNEDTQFFETSDEDIEDELVKKAEEAENKSNNTGLIERKVKEEKPAEETTGAIVPDNKIFSQETFTIDEEETAKAASAEALLDPNSVMSKNNRNGGAKISLNVIKVVLAVLLAVVSTSIGYTYFWLFKNSSGKDQ